jgi:NAD(P)-dependent dehydrogenase (short-subunit alcohol dehydrogenase family)
LTDVAIVTGGGSGIGAATVRRLAARGLHVVVADVRFDAAAAVAAEVIEAGAEATPVACDVTNQDSVTALVTHATEGGRPVAVLVNCAGLAGRSARLEDYAEQELNRLFDVNLKGVVLTIRAIGPVMRSQGRGAIVNVASIAGLNGSRGQVPYSGAKAGVIGITKAAAKELMDAGVRVNSVAPGFIATPMTDEMSDRVKKAWRLDQLVLGRDLGTPEHVAACIDFLASDAAAFVTGVTLPVDGGFRLGYP